MGYFVAKNSIVREIWGKSDTILLIFAGASAEFALHKKVDWLYYTGRLPKDPIGRLFSTVSYARDIVFSEQQKALDAISSINAIHAQIEAKRGMRIPNWAYKDVLFMLIDYSIRSFEILERKLEVHEKKEVYEVFLKVGNNMQINDLPYNYDQYINMRHEYIKEHLVKSEFTKDLYKQYRKHLGFVRFILLLESQALILPKIVRRYLGLRSFTLLKPMIFVYKTIRFLNVEWLLKEAILPSDYKEKIKSLDMITDSRRKNRYEASFK